MFGTDVILDTKEIRPITEQLYSEMVVKLSRDVEFQVDALVTKLNRRVVVGSLPVALETIRLLRTVIGGSRWEDAKALKDTIMEVDARLERAQPIELSVSSISKRVLQLISEEGTALDMEASDMHDDDDEQEDGTFRDKMKSALKQCLSELTDELETASSNIAAQALEHIHSEEFIMTIGGSPIVEQFLKEAAKLRYFKVIVAETAPFYTGHDMAASLAKVGIDTTLITDSAIFSIMSRVNKVILGTHAVTANGGIVAISGSQVVAAAAKHHSAPVVVCTGLHSLSPIYPYDTDAFNLCVSPSTMSNFNDAEVTKNVDLPNPYYDYVAPEFLSLFITNIGPHPPSYVQRLVADPY